jgi:energy-converting hydrogenase Eha subunit B
MSELIGVLMAGLTVGVYLCNSGCADRGHAHKLGRAFTEASIASRRLSGQTNEQKTLTRTELRATGAELTTATV